MPATFMTSARQFTTRFSLCYAFLMVGTGMQLPFLPLWLAAKNLNLQEIALVLGAMTGSRMLSIPVIAYIADRYRNRRRLLIMSGFASMAGYLLLSQAQSFDQILALAMLASIFNAPIFPLAEGFSSEASAAHGVQYGRIRLWASLSFLLGNLGGGLLLIVLPVSSVVYLIAVAQGFSAFVLLSLPPDPSTSTEGHREASLPGLGVKPLLTKTFLLLMLTGAIGQSSHAMINSFGPLLWHEAGQSELAIGSFWAVAVMIEVLLLYHGKDLVERFGAQNLMIAGIAGGFIRWVLMVPQLGYGYWVALQTLHALSFAMLHLATMQCLLLFVPRSSRNLAQGIYAAASGGLAMTIMTWTAGAMVGRLQSYTYLVMAGVSLAALAFALAFRRISPTGREVPAA